MSSSNRFSEYRNNNITQYYDSSNQTVGIVSVSAVNAVNNILRVRILYDVCIACTIILYSRARWIYRHTCIIPIPIYYRNATIYRQYINMIYIYIYIVHIKFGNDISN